MTSIQEDVHYDGGPAKGDLIFNLLLGVTLIGLPFTIGAIVRAVWLRFRITSRRISVTGGWMGKEKTQVVYSQVKEVRSVSRGFGAWGDMVLVLNDGLNNTFKHTFNGKQDRITIFTVNIANFSGIRPLSATVML